MNTGVVERPGSVSLGSIAQKVATGTLEAPSELVHKETPGTKAKRINIPLRKRTSLIRILIVANLRSRISKMARKAKTEIKNMP